MQAWTLISFLAFTGFAAYLTWWITRRDERSSSDGFFLGGRALTFPIIAGSLLLTNLSTEQMVGLNGSAYEYGFSVMAWEVVAVVALVAMALFFLPRFLRAGVTTVPQFLELRYGRPTQTAANVIFLSAYAVILIPVILYSGAMGLSQMLDIRGLTGIDEPISLFGREIPPDTQVVWLTIWVIGIMGSIYARFGGLRTLAVLDTINGVGLLVGGMVVAWLALNAAGGGDGAAAGWQALKEGQPDRITSVGELGKDAPFSTLFTGVALLNLFYWCTNQQIIQRTFGASSLAEGQKGVLLTGGLKLLGPVYLVIPGIVAYQLYFGEGVAPDASYGRLVRELLPDWFTGFFAAVMVGAILSSFNAALNSTSALFSIGLYRQFINPAGSERQMVRAAKWFVVASAITGMFIAMSFINLTTIFGYLQRMNGIYFIPIFAVVVVGMLHKRVPPQAGLLALLLGVGLIAGGYFLPELIFRSVVINPVKAFGIPEFHFLGIVFALLVALMLAMAAKAPTATAWSLPTRTPIDMTPWKHAKLAGGLLVLVVLGIYVAFA